jgi:hypothetical protein
VLSPSREGRRIGGEGETVYISSIASRTQLIFTQAHHSDTQ